MSAAAQLAEKASRLFTLPDIYLRLQNLLNNENVTIDQIAELIAMDAGLSARLLKIANSSFYNFPAQIATISRAITLIGHKELTNLVLATSVASSFKGISQEIIDMDSFWRHNVDTGLVARHLGKAANLKDIEALFVIGMLHNVGKLVVLSKMPTEAADILTNESNSIPWEGEQAVLGFTFAECGAELLKIWGLPDSVTDSVLRQHQPLSATVDPKAASILHIASLAASWMEEETKDQAGIDYLQLIDPAAWAVAEVELSDMDAAIEYSQVEAWNMLGLVSTSVY